MACILLGSSAVRVHDPQAYRKMDVTRELRERLLSCQTGFNLVSAAVVCVIRESISPGSGGGIFLVFTRILGESLIYDPACAFFFFF